MFLLVKRKRLIAKLAIIGMFVGSEAAASDLVYRNGLWATFKDNQGCWSVSQIDYDEGLLSIFVDQEAAVSVSFESESIHERNKIRISKSPSPKLISGNEQLSLISEGGTAWPRGSAEDLKIIKDLLSGRDLMLEMTVLIGKRKISGRAKFKSWGFAKNYQFMEKKC